VTLREVGLEQRVRLGPQARLLEQVRRRGDHRLALVAVRDLAVGLRRLVAHVCEQRLGQLGHGCRLARGGLREVDPRQIDARDQRLHPVGARQRRVGLQPLQRRVERGERLGALGRAGRREGAHDRLGEVDEHVGHVARPGRVGDRGEHRGTGGELGRRGRLRIERRQRLEAKPHRRLGLVGGARRGDLGQGGRDLVLPQQRGLVGVP
jgi:hypothetical protein